MQEYTALDPSFDEEKFKTLLSNVYVQMQQQWTKKDMESLRPYFTDSLYAQFDCTPSLTDSWTHTVRVAEPIILTVSRCFP